MNIEINPKTNRIEVEVDKDDITDANRLRKLQSYDEWKVIQKYYDTLEFKIKEAIINSTMTVSGRKLSDLKAVLLAAFTDITSIPNTVIMRVNEMQKLKKMVDQEEKDEGYND